MGRGVGLRATTFGTPPENPTVKERIPRAEVLVGHMTPDDVGSAVVECVRRRPGKDSYRPWRWALLAPVARVLPGPIAWLYRVTGHRR